MVTKFIKATQRLSDLPIFRVSDTLTAVDIPHLPAYSDIVLM